MNTRIPATALLAPALWLSLGACGDGSATTLVVDDTGGGDFTVTVTEDTPPRFDWPGANGFRVSVERIDDGLLMWRIVATDQDAGFPPPVTHGTSPAGAEEEVDEGPLEANESYRVRVTRVDGRSSTRDFSP